MNHSTVNVQKFWNHQPSSGFGPASCNILPHSPGCGATRRKFLTADYADYTDKK
jgi:hypothetical protein